MASRRGLARAGLAWRTSLSRWGPEALVTFILLGRACPGLSGGALLSLGPALGGSGRGQGRPASWRPESTGATLHVDGCCPDCLRSLRDSRVRPSGLQPCGQEGQGARFLHWSRCGHVSCCPGAGLAGAGAGGPYPLQTGQPARAPSRVRSAGRCPSLPAPSLSCCARGLTGGMGVNSSSLPCSGGHSWPFVPCPCWGWAPHRLRKGVGTSVCGHAALLSWGFG